MKIHKALQPRDDTDRLNVTKKGGRGLASTEDSVNPLEQGREVCIKK